MGSKHMLLWRPPDRSIGVFARAGVDAIARRLEGVGAREAVVHATVRPAPRATLVPFRRDPIALVSLRGDEDALGRARIALSTLPGRVEAWRVDESVPVARTAGARATLLTLFRKHPRIDRELFLARWYGEHTPLTLEVHPVVGYVRNAVVAPLLHGSAPHDGIVTEDFADERDLTSMRLFGRGPRALWNAVRIGRHISTFLDLRTIETWLVEERRL